MTRSMSASPGVQRLATILAQVRAGTPVATASPSGASMSSRLAAATRSSTSCGVDLASLRGRLLRPDMGSPDLLRRSRLLAVCRLTPIWRAASATPRPDSMRETSVSRALGVGFALGCWDMRGLLCRKRRQLTACGSPPYLSPPWRKQRLGT